MSDFHVLVPKLGESIQEATITKLFVNQGDTVVEDDLLFEVATDKVDSEIPSPVAGVVKEILCSENDLIPVGQLVMIISTGNEGVPSVTGVLVHELARNIVIPAGTVQQATPLNKNEPTDDHRFYSPLVKSIAANEGIPLQELASIKGSGLGGRVQKIDIVGYIAQKGLETSNPYPPASPIVQSDKPKMSVSIGPDDTIVKMGRIRKLIADHMVMSKQVSPHVTTVVEADVTNLVLWRNRAKVEFEQKYGEKLTYMPFFAEAAAKALAEFRQVNASVDGDSIILHKEINIGIAVATNDGNLVVPVIKDVDTKNIIGISRELNKLAKVGRDNKLNPDDIQGGTFTITNFGSFGGLIGTAIINQPQVAILAVGLIEKRPSVMETPTGDAIVVRHKMFLSLSYDHRVVDGMLGGNFLRRIADLLEQFEPTKF